MHLRTFVPIIVLVSFALIIAGCGNPPEEATEQPAQETTEQPAQETAAEATGEPEIPAAEESAPEIVAYVNERPLYREGLERELELVKSQYAQIYAQFGQDLRALLAGAAGRELELNLELEALNRLAGRELLFEEAEARGIEVTDARVDEKFAELYVEFLASRGMTEEEFEEYVQGVGSSMEEFLTSSKRSVREQLIIEALQNDVVGPVELSEDEVADYFEENRADYEQEEQVRASHILVETQTQADVLVEHLNAGEDFAELAKEHSIGPSSTDGGDLGWFGRGDMVPAFEEAAFALDDDEISDIVETEYGFHIILRTGYREAVSPELQDVLEDVRADAEEAARNEAFRSWYQESYEAADVEITDPLLDAVRLRNEDPERGLEALERLLEDDRIDDPYLPYLVGLAYEERRQQAVNEKKALEEDDEDTEDVGAKIAALERQIEQATARALELYEQALESAGDDSAIRERIQILQAPATQTPSENEVTP